MKLRRTKPVRIIPGFWPWFFSGCGGRPGCVRLLDPWLLAHAGVGLLMARLVRKPLDAAADTVLFPIASVFICLAFAFSGSIMSALESRELDLLTAKRAGGVTDAIHAFQLSILVIIATLIAWGCAGLEIFEPLRTSPRLYFTIKAALFALCSMSIRECWHIPLVAQFLSLARKKVGEARPAPDHLPH